MDDSIGPNSVSFDHGPRTTDHASPGPRPPAPGHASSAERPPFGVSWRALYAVVAGTLLVLIALFALFTKAFE